MPFVLYGESMHIRGEKSAQREGNVRLGA